MRLQAPGPEGHLRRSLDLSQRAAPEDAPPYRQGQTL